MAVAQGDIIVMTDVDFVVSASWVCRLVQSIIENGDSTVVGWQYNIGKTYWSRHMQKLYEYEHKKGISADGYVTNIDTKNFAILSKILKKYI